MTVKWGTTSSQGFTVSNGVRQGSILSPFLFNVYMDELSTILNQHSIGCFIGGRKINHLMYADDLVLVSPSSRGMQVLLDSCHEFGVSNDIVYNGNKSATMCCMPKRMSGI